MTHLSRKDFIRLSSWSMLAVMLPSDEIKAVTNVFNAGYEPNANDYEKAKQIAKEAKVFFYKKNYKKAEELYLQCIQLAPNAIRFYDNLDNVYGAKNNHLASAELFKQGLLKNEKKIAFYDRSARSLMRLELGSSKQAAKFKALNKKDSLLKDAEKLYQKAIALDPSKKYLAEGLNKVQFKISNPGISSKKSEKSKKDKSLFNAKKREHKKALHKVLEAKTDTDIENSLKKVESKKRVTLFDEKEIEQQKNYIAKEKKKYLRLLLTRSKTDTVKSLALSEKIFELDPSDSTSLHKLKSAYYKNNKYSDFIGQRQKFAEKKQTLYSYLGVMDAIEIAHDNRQVTREALTNASNVGTMVLGSFGLLEVTEVDVVDKIAKLQTLQSNFSGAKKAVENTISHLATSAPAVVNKIIYRYASIFNTEGNFEESKNILLIGLKESNTDNSNYIKLTEIAKNKTGETFKHKLPLYYLLFDVYKRLADNDNAALVLAKIAENNPKDKFILKRK